MSPSGGQDRLTTQLQTSSNLELQREIRRLTADVRESFSDGFWVGMDAPAELPKRFVDKAFAERNQKPIKEQDSKGRSD